MPFNLSTTENPPPTLAELQFWIEHDDIGNVPFGTQLWSVVMSVPAVGDTAPASGSSFLFKPVGAASKPTNLLVDATTMVVWTYLTGYPTGNGIDTRDVEVAYEELLLEVKNNLPTCNPGDSKPCYTGPPNTEGVGVCVGGTSYCNSGVWGPCQNEITPTVDDCLTPTIDEDCDNDPMSGCICTPYDVQNCYTGPTGTEGVSHCTGGDWTCAADGKSWGPCQGQSLPLPEQCQVAGDENCDGTEATCNPILHYTFDGDANNTGSLSGYHGAATSVTWTTGKVGQAVSFGTSAASYLDINGIGTPLSDYSTYTIALWYHEPFVPPVSPGQFPVLFDFRGSTGIQAYHGMGGNQYVVICASAYPFESGCVHPAGPVGQWNHMLIRYAGSTKEPGGGAPIQLYLNGVLDSTIDNPNSDVFFYTNIAANGALGKYSNFSVDDLKIYQTVFDDQGQCETVIGGTWSGSACTLP